MVILFANGKTPETDRDLLGYFSDKLFERWRSQSSPLELVWLAYRDRDPPSKLTVAEETESGARLAVAALTNLVTNELSKRQPGVEPEEAEVRKLVERITPVHRIYLRRFCDLAEEEPAAEQWNEELVATGLPRLLGVIEQLNSVQEQLKNRQRILALQRLAEHLKQRPNLDQPSAELTNLLERGRQLQRQIRTDNQLPEFIGRYQLQFDEFCAPGSAFMTWKTSLINAFPGLLADWQADSPEDRRRVVGRLQDKMEEFREKNTDPRAYLDVRLLSFSLSAFDEKI